MADFWNLAGDEQTPEGELDRDHVTTDQPVRKEQITIRLDPGMVADARLIAARKGIGHHTLLRMWVMEGITRAYQEGLLEAPPRSWTAPERRPTRTADDAARTEEMAPPAGSRWLRPGRRRGGG